MTTPNDDIKHHVLEEIQAGRAKMRPRWIFALQAALAFGGGAILALALVYVIGLGVFLLQDSGVWYATAFGRAGWYELVRSLPWTLMLLAAAFAAGLELLVRQHAFAYRRPLLYSAIGVVAFAAVTGAAVSAPGLQQRLAGAAARRHLPFFADRMPQGHMRAPEPASRIWRGKIIIVRDAGFGMEDWHGLPLAVIVTPHTQYYAGAVPGAGDDVVVFGPFHDGGIDAVGVRVIGE